MKNKKQINLASKHGIKVLDVIVTKKKKKEKNKVK